MHARSNHKCPHLQPGEVPTCSADREALRIPPQDHLARVCLTELHRRCEIFRCFLGLRVAKIEGSGEGTRGGARPPKLAAKR